jgi:23S rRNA pseudouridine2605 synthase
VTVPFSQKQSEPQAEKQEAARSSRPVRGPRIEEGGLIRNRKRERERKREDALGRLTTRDSRRPEKGEKKDEDGTRKRSANVWMAPGARPSRARAEEEGSSGGRARSVEAGKRRFAKRDERHAVSAENPVTRTEKREHRPVEGRNDLPERRRRPKSGFNDRPADQKTPSADERGPRGEPPKNKPGKDKPGKDKRPPKRTTGHAPDATPRGRHDGRKGRHGADRRR